MNIDDFIFSDQASTPAADDSLMTSATSAANNTASNSSAIPIKNRKDSSNPADHIVPQSVGHQRSGNNEFGYVKRHQRKTSIDDRMVSGKIQRLGPLVLFSIGAVLPLGLPNATFVLTCANL